MSTILSDNVKVGVKTLSAGTGNVSLGASSADSSETLGIIENSLTYSEQGFALMRYIPKESAVFEGAVIQTADESLYPAGMSVGTVEKILPEANGLSLCALVKPSVDLFNITNVFVIISETK